MAHLFPHFRRPRPQSYNSTNQVYEKSAYFQEKGPAFFWPFIHSSIQQPCLTWPAIPGAPGEIDHSMVMAPSPLSPFSFAVSVGGLWLFYPVRHIRHDILSAGYFVSSFAVKPMHRHSDIRLALTRGRSDSTAFSRTRRHNIAQHP